MRSNAAEQLSTESSRPFVAPEHPRPEMVTILHKEFASDVTLSIVADGKHQSFKLNRRQLFKLLSQGYEALSDMEPHAPAGFP